MTENSCIKDEPPTHSHDGTFFSRRHDLYYLCRFAGYGDKRGRNKPFGPGGGTRRLHHMPVADPQSGSLGSTKRASDGGEIGSTRV